METPVSAYTFLYTDIEGSTRFWERQPAAMRSATTRHNRILRAAIEAHGGQVFRTAGDAFCASFTSAPAALAAAVDAQRALSAEVWDLESPLRVRVALHTGEAEPRDGDFIGASLNHIGRLLAVCHGGQTLLTLVTEELVRDRLPGGTRLVDLGEHRFRDLLHPERIFQAAVEGLPDSFPLLNSIDHYPNNLPSQVTRFIGRERELREVGERLMQARLVTLTGPGGTGKSRLALQAAAEALERFPDGAWLVELAPVSNPDLVLQAIATVLSVGELPNRSLEQAVADTLRPKKLLLILDNCEHLLDACAQVCDRLLHSCPELRILTSSREMLGIAGETLFRVPSLSLPGPEAPIGELEKAESVRLFVERAAAIQPQFSLTPQNAAAIASICQRLDGIPLAIELAAVRVALFTPEQIAARLKDRFRLLTGGSRTAIPRQQTLEALFDWSYDLLSEAERKYFRQLSVFSGGWTIEAAEALCHKPDLMGDGDSDALELLAQLVNKSLVVVDRQSPAARYRMLETTRQYAQKKLVEAMEGSQVRQCHMEYYAGRLRETWPAIQAHGLGWLFLHYQWLRDEADNIRAAQQWALENDLETALIFAKGVPFQWGNLGFGREMREFVKQTLQQVESLPGYQGQPDPQHSLNIAFAWLFYGDLSLTLGITMDAFRSTEKAVYYARLSGDPFGLALSLSLMCQMASLVGDEDTARRSSDEGISLARQNGENWVLAVGLSIAAAFLLIPSANFEEANRYIEESAALFAERDDPWGTAMVSLSQGTLAAIRGEHELARQCFLKSMAMHQAMGNQYLANTARSGLADLARFQGQPERATGLYVETLQTWMYIGNLGAVARCLECLAFIAIDSTKPGELSGEPPEQLIQAATLLGAAESLRKKQQARMSPPEQVEYDQAVAGLQALLDRSESLQKRVKTAWAAGSTLAPDQVIAYTHTLPPAQPAPSPGA